VAGEGDHPTLDPSPEDSTAVVELGGPSSSRATLELVDDRRCAGPSPATLIRWRTARLPRQPGGAQAALHGVGHELGVTSSRATSNTEIETRLRISVRTVESHLYHAMTKLGVTRRHQLPAPLPDD
jgi:DNA-binding CsgD family transcriptional regulator